MNLQMFSLDEFSERSAESYVWCSKVAKETSCNSVLFEEEYEEFGSVLMDSMTVTAARMTHTNET